MKIGFVLPKTSVSNNFNKKHINFNGVDKKISYNKNMYNDVIEISGTQTKAKVYAADINDKAYEQIKTICSHPVFKDLPIRIMPDVHAGKGVPIGFTSPVGAKGEIIPSLISGDIGCGMLCCEIDTNGKDIDYEKLDKVIRNYIVPSYKRMSVVKRQMVETFENDIINICDNVLQQSSQKMISSLGTLGGGNHFIELDKSENGKIYLVVHSGSRGFGQTVYKHHFENAIRQNPYEIKSLSYLTGSEAKQYLTDMKLAQKYAEINRRIIADEIISHMGWSELSSFESVHNYIGDDKIIRKGSISAYKGQKILIPLNMKDGAIIAMGKGNSDWNCSAPHGAGRKMSRSMAKEQINLEDYRKTMDGIYTTSICEKTIDESPQAYKKSSTIMHGIIPTADILCQILPLYNFKNIN